MKYLSKIKLLFTFVILLLSLNACTSKNFIPLYESTEKDTIQIEQTALLVAPIQLDLVSHNNQEKNVTPPYKAMAHYRLLPGDHLIGFRYQNMHNNEENEQEVFTSQAVLLKFTAEPGKTYTVNFKKPENFIEARKIEENFQIKLSHNNQLIATSIYMIENSFEEKTTSEKNKQPPTINNAAIVHLKYWWDNASKAEQENFNQWLKQEPN